MPQTPRRRGQTPRRSEAAGIRKAGSASKAAGDHKHEPGAKLTTFAYRGKSVEIHAAEKGCCVVIDGERVDYVVDDDGVYSHDMAYVKFGSPEELAEEVIRQWGQAKIARTPVPHDHDHDDHHDH